MRNAGLALRICEFSNDNFNLYIPCLSHNYGLDGKLTALLGCSGHHGWHLRRISRRRLAALLLIDQTGYAGYRVAAHAGVQGLVDEYITVDAEELIAVAALKDAFVDQTVEHLNAAVALAQAPAIGCCWWHRLKGQLLEIGHRKQMMI